MENENQIEILKTVYLSFVQNLLHICVHLMTVFYFQLCGYSKLLHQIEKDEINIKNDIQKSKRIKLEGARI